MYVFYTATSPECHAVAIMLEVCGLEYRTVALGEGENIPQLKPAESGAIIEGALTIADHIHNQVSRYAPKSPIEFPDTLYSLSADERNTLFQTLNARLQDQTYLAGDQFSFDDMLAWPLFHTACQQNASIEKHWPALARWRHDLANRPAIGRALTIKAAF